MLTEVFGRPILATPGPLLCFVMLAELPSLDSALSQRSLPSNPPPPHHPWRSGWALLFLGTSIRISIPLSQVSMLCSEPPPSLGRVLSSWARSGGAWSLSHQPPACLPAASGSGSCLSSPGPAVPLDGGACLGCCQSRRLPSPLYLSARPSVPCSSLEYSDAEKLAC